MNCTLRMPTLADRLSSCTLSKWELMQALFHQNNGRGGYPLNINGHDCLLSSIEREDGSGHCLNLTVYCDRQKLRCFCRTSD